MSIKVLIADDHVFYREGVRALLSNVPDIEVIGEAGSGEEVLVQAKGLQPNVILLDLKMPGMNGIDATRKIHEAQPKIGVLVITMLDDDDSVFAAMRARLPAQRRRQRMRSYGQLSPWKEKRRSSVQPSPNAWFNIFLNRLFHPKNQPAEFAELTDRQLEILDLMAQGHNNPVIANKLSLSIKTVQNYVSSILTKLQVADRAQAIVRAREAGFGAKD